MDWLFFFQHIVGKKDTLAGKIPKAFLSFFSNLFNFPLSGDGQG